MTLNFVAYYKIVSLRQPLFGLGEIIKDINYQLLNRHFAMRFPFIYIFTFLICRLMYDYALMTAIESRQIIISLSF